MKRNFISGVVVLSFSSFLIKILGFITRIYMTNIMGAEGTGLYQLILSVYAVGASFAVSGISVAVCALTGAKPSAGHKILSSAVKITLVTGFVASFVCFFFAKDIAAFTGDVRAALPIRIISVCFPFTAVFSCLTGYFNGKGVVRLPVSGQLVEQAVRILIVFLFLEKYVKRGVASACAAASFGICVGEIISAVFLIFAYTKKRTYGKVTGGYTKKLLSLSIPSAAGGYFGSVIHTAENSMIPAMLIRYGLSHKDAMASLGIIKGMAVPIACFPNIIISAVATVILPAVSRAAKTGRINRIKDPADDLFRLCFFIGGLFACFFCTFGNEICMFLYKNPKAGKILSFMGIATPFLYVNIVSGSILYGAGKQGWSLLTGMAEGLIRLILLFFLVPAKGIDGYLITGIAASIFGALLNIFSINRACGAGKGCFGYFICMLISFLVSQVLGNSLHEYVRLPGVLFIYIVAMALLKTVRFSDFYRLKCNIFAK